MLFLLYSIRVFQRGENFQASLFSYILYNISYILSSILDLFTTFSQGFCGHTNWRRLSIYLFLSHLSQAQSYFQLVVYFLNLLYLLSYFYLLGHLLGITILRKDIQSLQFADKVRYFLGSYLSYEFWKKSLHLVFHWIFFNLWKLNRFPIVYVGIIFFTFFYGESFGSSAPEGIGFPFFFTLVPGASTPAIFLRDPTGFGTHIPENKVLESPQWKTRVLIQWAGKFTSGDFSQGHGRLFTRVGDPPFFSPFGNSFLWVFWPLLPPFWGKHPGDLNTTGGYQQCYISNLRGERKTPL